MSLAALDVTADRVVALAGEPGTAQVALLDGEAPELPLALSLERRQVQVGRVGLALCRRSPHLTCQGFLPRLGEAAVWRHGRHRLDPAQALAAVLHKARAALPQVKGAVFAVPVYLTRDQVHTFVRAAQDVGWPVVGVLARSLAAGLHSYGERPWHNVGLVVDVDDYALSCTVLRAGEAELTVLGRRALPGLGLRQWRERLHGRVADACIRASRRDPRDSPEADQMLFDQLDRVLEGCSQNRPVALHVRGHGWYQDVMLHPGEAASACQALARHAAAEVGHALAWAEEQMTTSSIYLTAGAARLPGLVAAVYSRTENRIPVVVLAPGAAAQAAHELAARISRREVPPGLFDPAAPLPQCEPGEMPAMLPFPAPRRHAAHEPF